MITYPIRLITVLLCLFGIPQITAAEADPLTMELISEYETVQPGKPFWVALHFHLENDWHAYWKNAGDAGIPLTIKWTLPSGFEVRTVEWPTPKQFNLEDMVGYGYEGDFDLLAEIYPSPSTPLNETLTLKADIDWLACSSTTCLPGKTEKSLIVKTSDATPTANPQEKEHFKSARDHLPRRGDHFEVKRIDGTLEIQVPKEMLTQGKNWSIEFYPETPDHIHGTLPVSLSDRETVILHETKTHPTSLLGVLTIKEKESSLSYAFAINNPIQNTSAIAMNESSTSMPPNESQGDTAPAEFEGGIVLALVFAFLGGMILNLMPCVLPVISFKIMSFVKMSGESRSLVLKHGLMFSLGVIMSFWLLAGVMLILQAYGESVGWGFQLQEPIFVGFLAALMLIVGLNMFGVFEAGLGVASWAGEKQQPGLQKGSTTLTSSFLSGVLATAIATPCTGPFLGSAIGFAFTLPAFYALVIFTVLGLGMASPYLILSAFPSCLRYMPKPGAWMVTFKELVGFVMMATVLWLVWIFAAETSHIGVMVLLFALLFISFACWIYGKWSLPTTSRIAKSIAYVCALFFLGLGGSAIVTASSTSEVLIVDAGNHSGKAGSIREWEPFSPARIAELQKQGVPVIVDFTAKWCLICQANHLILSQDEVSSKLAENGVVKMKADWTKNDPVITKELRKFGRNGVPLYVMYGANGKTEILPQVLTADIVSDHIDIIADSK